GVAQRRKRDEVHSLLELGDESTSDLESQPSLSGASGAGQGHEAHSRFLEKADHLTKFSFPTDKRRGFIRQGGACIEGHLQIDLMRLPDLTCRDLEDLSFPSLEL